MSTYQCPRSDLPQMPLADIDVRAAGSVNAQTVSSRAWINTGYSYTIIPHGHISRLKAKGPLSRGVKKIQDEVTQGEPYERSYWVSIIIPGFNVVIEDIEVITRPLDYGILGRDLLNRLKLLLDGPHSRWAIFNE